MSYFEGMMFCDCSGPCHTCVAFSGGNCLAGHGDDYYSLVSRKEAMVRLGSRRTPGGRPYTQKELNDLACIAGTAAPAEIVPPEEVLVSVDELKVLKDLSCEYEEKGLGHCREAAERRGGHCRSCWARLWAERVLAENGL